MHLGRTGVIKLNDKVVGIIGEVHPKIVNSLEISGRVGVFEINVDKIIDSVSFDKKYEEISHFQSIDRDLSFWINKDIKYSEIKNQVNAINNPLIKEIEFVDQYFNEENPTQKSITISLKLQSSQKTLTDDETNKVIEEVSSAIIKNLKAEFRNK